MAAKEVAVAVVGYTGGVGKCLVRAMGAIGLKPFALVRSNSMAVGDLNNNMPLDFTLLSDRLKKAGGIPVIADVTASGKVQEHYKAWLSQGISVVAANKGIFAGPEQKYKELLEASKTGNSRLMHEATVGAGLPIVGTLSNLKATSHQIQTVEGVVSGSLAYVLGQVAGGKATLSQAVKQAKELGFTEPDPRDDLGGMDVARKAVILARLAGVTGVELDGMEIESLVPKPLRDVSVEEFLTKLDQYDDDMAKQVQETESTGGRLHYAAKVDAVQKKIKVGLLACDAAHPFNNAGPDNLVAITTNYYTRPLVVQGAGAGGDVTATGVLADILQCAYQQ